MNNLICPVSNEKTDSNVSRLTILISSVLVVWYIFSLQPISLYIALGDYFIRAFLNGNFSPLRSLASAIANLLGWKPKMIDKAPKVFASRLGFLCLLAASVLFLLEYTLASTLIAGMATSLFLLDAIGNFCVGCLIYHHLVFPFFTGKTSQKIH